MKTVHKFPRVERLFRAFSDRTRLRILGLLWSGELCVCDLVEVLRVPQPTASRHLSYLRKAGLVTARKEGYWSYYRLAPASDAVQQKLLDCLACCLQDMPELVKDSQALRKCRGKKCC